MFIYYLIKSKAIFNRDMLNSIHDILIQPCFLGHKATQLSVFNSGVIRRIVEAKFIIRNPQIEVLIYYKILFDIALFFKYIIESVWESVKIA
jgi:hypothetical protein